MTPKIPLGLKIRRKAERDIAYVQDVLVEELYRIFPDAIIHGGTAIWRCYGGNRFSEDIDAYLVKDEAALERFFSTLEKRGFKVIKKRIKENSVYSDFIFNGIPARFEATFQDKKSVTKKYETSESFFITVKTLSPDNLIQEKIDTYMKRRKIRDLYDIYFLLSYAEDAAKIKEKLRMFVKHFESPLDEENLSAIVISGAVPTSKELLEAIQRWAK